MNSNISGCRLVIIYRHSCRDVWTEQPGGRQVFLCGACGVIAQKLAPPFDRPLVQCLAGLSESIWPRNKSEMNRFMTTTTTTTTTTETTTTTTTTTTTATKRDLLMSVT